MGSKDLTRGKFADWVCIRWAAFSHWLGQGRRPRNLGGRLAAGWLLTLLVMGVFQSFPATAQTEAPPATNQIILVEMEGKVEVSRGDSTFWDLAYTNQVLAAGDRLRTGARSRAVIRWSNLTLLRLDQNSFLEVPAEAKGPFILNLLRGALFFFHRDKPGVFPVGAPTMSAIIRGTEFHLHVAADGTSTLQLVDGEVEMTNQFGPLVLQSGQAGVAEPGKRPVRTAALPAVNVIQWCLYYPGVLDLDELRLTGEERQTLQDSLAAYRSGDLLRAVAQYPAGRQPASDEERVYLAAVLLAVGQVEQMEAVLGEDRGQRTEDRGQRTEDRGQRTAVERLAEALRKLVAAVKFQPFHATPSPERSTVLATEWLAESYYQQSQAKLEEALVAARRAVEQSTNFAFGWERVAELEFSFGRIRAASAALEKSLRLAPRNAQALALNGFLLAAQNRIPQALQSFEQAIAADGALGNAWLGRGLCRMRRGQTEAGLQDLQVAATVEPQRALLRSYLAKAYSQARDNARAGREIELAKKLDPKDPTGWFYSALLNQQQNRINEAVDDLEKSQALNENRRVDRSRLLLDQDRALRGVNLARIYQDDGLSDVSVREAARAVNTDYANFSAHLFLADSYNALRDLRQINLRYETPWLSEYLVANLLAPVGAGTLSPYVTQQEYSKLFERDRVGLASDTEYLSRGDWFQAAAQHGTFGNSSYVAEVVYRSESGQRPNNDLEQLTGSLKFRQQMTPQDSLYVQGIYYTAEAGDVNQYYDQSWANDGLRTKERQEPILLAGYHHAWAPGSHSLVLAGRLADTFTVFNPQQQTLLLDRSITPDSPDVITTSLTQDYESELEMYTVEGQQIWQQPRYALIGGARFQSGQFRTENHQRDPVFPVAIPITLESDQSFSTDSERFNVYGYVYWRLVDPLLLVAGGSYDRLVYPENFRYAPLTDAEDSQDQVSPKAGFIWTPTGATTVRGAYARALGGVSLDQSFQLEPSQVAGFNQAFRSIIPESVVGANAAAPFETWGLSLEHRFPTRTYVGLSGEWLESDLARELGVFEFLPGTVTGTTRQRLDYQERSLLLTVNQLLSREWSLGARYRLSQADLEKRFEEIPTTSTIYGDFAPREDLESVLHQVNLFAIYNHRSGVFAELNSLWNRQSNRGYSPDEPGDGFWQFNAFVGYRFWRRQAELKLGLLNFTDQDYQLEPLNLTADLPRDRMFLARFRFNF